MMVMTTKISTGDATLKTRPSENIVMNRSLSMPMRLVDWMM